MVKIGFKKLHDDAIIPCSTNIYDAGLDFFSLIDTRIDGRCTTAIPTGIAWEPKFKWYAWFLRFFFKIFLKVEGRSGLSFKNDIETGAGVVDQAYRGEIKIKVFNTGRKSLEIKKGDRIAQGIPFVIPKVKVKEMSALSCTDRGANGFGSSGR
jgi:dUTP pyrophosphatase